MKKDKRGRKRIISIAVALVCIAIISFILFIYMYKETQVRMKGIMSKEEKEKKFKEQEEDKNKIKKYKGKENDKTAPKITFVIQKSKTIDCEKRIFPEINIIMEDESGVYAAKIYFNIDGKNIGFIQQNINKKNKNVEFTKIIDDSIILDNMKTFKNYEGAELNIKIEGIDNNLISDTKEIKGLKIADYTKPETPELIWTYKSRGKKSGELYFTKEKKNSFIFKVVQDLPLMKCNQIKEYVYFLKNEQGKIIKKGKIEGTKESAYMIKEEINVDGKYSMVLRAYDLAGNYSETEHKFGVDTMQPFVRIDILEGQRFYMGDIITIKIDAIDTLSGVAKCRVASTKEGLLKQEWFEIEKNVKYEVEDREGLYDVWCQVQDRAKNNSSAANVAYAIVKDRSLRIKSSSNEMKTKERVLKINKDSYKRGKLEIESAEEK